MFISKKAVIAGVSTLVLVGGGAALAYFESGGTGSTTLDVGRVGSNALLLSVADEQFEELYPGKTIRVPIYAENTNDTQVSVVSIGVDDVTVTPRNERRTCEADANFDVTAAARTNPTPVPGDTGGVRVGTLTVEMIETGVNQNDCRGATVDVDLITPAVDDEAAPE